MYNITEYTLKHMDISVAPGRRSSRPRAGVGADAQYAQYAQWWPLRNTSAVGKWDIWIDGCNGCTIQISQFYSFFGWMIYNIYQLISTNIWLGWIYFVNRWMMDDMYTHMDTHMDTGWYRPPWSAAKWVWVLWVLWLHRSMVYRGEGHTCPPWLGGGWWSSMSYIHI